ncbi:MAG: hypothetical protein ACLSHF_09555 [[Eubacterium] siraeum]
MKTHEFITTMRDDLHCQEDSTILAWLAFTGEVADNTESDYENELDETMRALCFVKNNFNAEVLQKSLGFQTLANEIIYGAAMFHAGASEEKVRDYAMNGILECGYIPSSFDEIGTLTLIQLGDSKDQVFIAENEPYSIVLNTVGQVAREARQSGKAMDILLKSHAETNLRLNDLCGCAIGSYMMSIFSTTSAVGNLICCDPETLDIKEIPCPMLNRQENTEKTEESKAAKFLLRKKVEDNFAELKEKWMQMLPAELIERCEEIEASIRMVETLPSAVSDEDAEYLLRFKNPLEVISSEWISRNGIDAFVVDDEMSHLLWALRDRSDAEQFYEMEPESSDEDEAPTLSM